MTLYSFTACYAPIVSTFSSIRNMKQNWRHQINRYLFPNCIYMYIVTKNTYLVLLFLCGMTTTLTHWGRVTHICVGNLNIIGSDNGLSPSRRQATIWNNGGILLIGPIGTNFNEILIEIQTFSFKKKYLKVASAKWRPFCLGINELIAIGAWK